MKKANNTNFYNNLMKNCLCKFNLITSNHGKDWLLALIWIVIFESISSIIEYKNIDYSENYITHFPDGVFKELLVAVLLVSFLWYGIYNFVFMQKNRFFLFALYASICVYLFFTHDITFSLMLHNINPFEFPFNELSFYLFFQLILKIIITYLIYKMFISINYVIKTNKLK